jgi:parvulin-like peptidyl-prolyl isomerase
MKRTLIGAAAAGLIALSAGAYAQSAAPPADAPRAEQRQERMERRAARMEERAGRRLERLKADLKLTPQQEQLWSPVAAQLRRMQDERRSFRQANMGRLRDAELPQRLDIIAERQVAAAAQMRDLSNAVKPLWATLSAEQKETVRKAMPGGGRWGERRG